MINRMTSRESYIEKRLYFWRFIHMNSSNELLKVLNLTESEILSYFKSNNIGIVLDDPDWTSCELRLISVDIFSEEISRLVAARCRVRHSRELIFALNNFYLEIQNIKVLIAINETNVLGM